MAVLADDSALQSVADNAAAAAEAAQQAKAAAMDIKAKLEDLKTFSVAKKVGENGAIYGSVTAAEVVSALEGGSKLALGSPKVTYDQSISKTGTYDLRVSIHPDVDAELKLEVLSEE